MLRRDPLSRGDATVFLTRPISLGLLLGAVALLLIALPNIRKKREEVFEEAEA